MTSSARDMGASVSRPSGGGRNHHDQHSSMDARLQEIIDRGSPAQAEMAQQLTTSRELDLLYDAYLNDPYLTRN